MLTLWAELRGWLYDGDVFALEYTALEAGINTSMFAAVAACLWVSQEMRHLWQRSISLRGAVLDGELYTYSAVWLVIAVAALLGGAWRFGRTCYQSGMALLLLVVVKLFLVDMAGLQGLLRVASFLGMGLALLAVAYLHKRLQPAVQAPSSSISTGM